MSSDEFEYDVALSLAGEDRGYVTPIAEQLKQSGVKVFYDRFEQSAMWGEDVLVFLDEVFRKKARYAVVFISHHYVSKVWPQHESKSAHARALIQQDSPYFLPVRLDDSELPGLRPTVGYIDARETGREQLVGLILEKVGAQRWIDRVPRTDEEEALLLAVRPPAWEYLLFAAVLRRRTDVLEPKRRDHEVRYAHPSGPVLDEQEATSAFSRVFTEAMTNIVNFNRLLAPDAQEAAFGPPGEAGDAARIEHLAARMVDVYEECLDWSARLRSLQVPETFSPAFDIAASFMDLPVRQFNEFVDHVVREVDRLPTALQAGEKVELTLTITLDLEEGVNDRFAAELKEIERAYGV